MGPETVVATTEAQMFAELFVGRVLRCLYA